MSHVKVVLFVSGKGADETKYKPNSDQSQWWGRHDALVRSVAAFLFGPAAPAGCTRELVLIFDEDFCVMEMWIDAISSAIFPSEQNIISAWKDATKRLASSPNGEATTSNLGLNCRIRAPRKSSAPGKLENRSKREILESIQKSCSMEFLREHGLNCSLSVALKKVNRKLANRLWHQWKSKQTQKGKTESTQQGALEDILSKLLEPSRVARDTGDNDSNRVVAGILHESGEWELPVWGRKIPPKERNNPLQACFFLGAVRDMSKVEKGCLLKVASRKEVPLVKVRLGPVAEFTSKILTVVAFHQSCGVLDQSLLKLMDGRKSAGNDQQDSISRKRPREKQSSQTKPVPVPSMHIVMSVPINTNNLTNDLNARTRVLWCIIRCTVVSLWRSRLAGSTDRALPLKVLLTMCFLNDQSLTLDQEFVRPMAERHQAAPSEFQILTSLQTMIQKEKTPMKVKAKLVEVVNTATRDSGGQHCFAIDMLNHDGTKDAGRDLSEYFYSQGKKSTDVQSQNVVVLMSIDNGDATVVNSLARIRRKFAKACQKAGVPLTQGHLLASNTCQDREASIITLLQHFSYQKCLSQIAPSNS